LVALRFDTGFAALEGRAAFADFSDLLAGACAAAFSVTFSDCFVGAAADLVFLRISLPGGATGAAATAVTVGGVEFVLPFGRPPFRAN
jgi:hypothetical protein